MERKKICTSRIKREKEREKSGEWHLGPSFGEQHDYEW